jgi:rhodanese-related sulfurtransferase
VGAGDHPVPVTRDWRKELATMRKAFSFNLFSHFVPVLLFFATAGAFPGRGNSAAQESSDLTSPKKQVVHPEVPRIPAKELKELLAKKADIVVVDTDPADSYELWHIPSAINIAYASMNGTAKRDSMLARLPKDKLIVLYCLCEEGGDSSEVALILRKMDYRRDRIKVLEGGLIQWDAKGYPMFKKETPDGE